MLRACFSSSSSCVFHFLQNTHQCEQLAKFPETLVCDGTAATNRARKKLVQVVATNGKLKELPVCSAVVDSESKESILLVYEAVAFMMKNAGRAASLARTRLLISDFGLGLVQAPSSAAVLRYFGGRERVNVVSQWAVFNGAGCAARTCVLTEGCS